MALIQRDFRKDKSKAVNVRTISNIKNINIFSKGD